MWMKAVGLVMVMGNIFLVSDAALAEAGVRQAKMFYGWSAFYVLLLIVFSLWMFAYRDHFGFLVSLTHRWSCGTCRN